MKIVVLAFLAAIVHSAPQFDDSTAVAILRDDREHNDNGNFNYVFEADNGIVHEASGTPGSKGQSNIQGIYSFPLPDGTLAEVRYIADDLGFRVESPLLPTPHPDPPHVAELLRIAEEQRAQGITFE
ncbi:cuticle protein AM1159-like [Cherax quadricarinatus]|uniref:cuticle protein AM1159-like n=1 Tax=Cherax quadricarinatus TaxID=27406 RepID=UPI00387E519F